MEAADEKVAKNAAGASLAALPELVEEPKPEMQG